MYSTATISRSIKDARKGNVRISAKVIIVKNNIITKLIIPGSFIIKSLSRSCLKLLLVCQLPDDLAK